MSNEFRIKNGAISPNMVITDTTVSTSTTTGALQVSGGAGIVGNVYASAFYGAATGLTSIPGANVSGAVPSATSATTATTAGTVTMNAQPNITSVGTLSTLTVSGTISGSSPTGSITLDAQNSAIAIGRVDNVASNPYIDFNSSNTSVNYDARIVCVDGSGSDGGGSLRIVAGQVWVTGTSTSTSTITGALRVGGGMGVAGNVYAGAFYGSGTGLYSIPGANVAGAVSSATSATTATTAGTVTTNAQPNITSVGSSLTVSSSLLIGRIDNTASTPTIEFNSGATSVDYDARILCSGGNGTNDGGDLAVTASTFYVGAKFGYRTGVGSSVTQLTSRTTSVTINAPVGRITLVSATTTAGQVSSFTVNNSYINSTDVVMFSKFSGSGYYIISTRSLSVGSFVVDVYTPVAVTSAEAPAFNFAIIRGTLS